MGTPPAPAPEPSSSNPVILVLNRLLRIKTWTQTGITLVLGITVFLGVMVYRYPQQLFELIGAAMHEPPESGIYMSPLKSEVQRQMNDLLQMFGGPNAMLGVTTWSVDLPTNRALFVTGAFIPQEQAHADEQMAGRWKWPRTVLSEEPERNHLIAQLYLGRVVCGKGPERWPLMVAFPTAQEYCIVPIPPEGFGLVGVIVGLWATPIADEERLNIETAFRAAAWALIWRKHG